MAKLEKRESFEIGGHEVLPGERKTVELPVSVLSDHTPVTMSVHVIHGRRPGPVVFVSAAIHGDEVIGVEIVRRLLKSKSLKTLRGTLLAVPIVNSFGFMNHSRYLPDRRDLNRSFPGSASGSLASRLAHIFMQEIVCRCEAGIDLHSAAIHRTNLPQIRYSATQPRAKELAKAFGAPLTLQSSLREGSLREAAQQHGVEILLYEAGEGLRFDEFAVRVGVSGILRVLRHMEMIPAPKKREQRNRSLFSNKSSWVRAPAGGLLRNYKTIGDKVEEGDILGVISDPFGESEAEVTAEMEGLVIGRTHLPIVNEGDGLFHIARIRANVEAGLDTDEMLQHLEDGVLLDEDEII